MAMENFGRNAGSGRIGGGQQRSAQGQSLSNTFSYSVQDDNVMKKMIEVQKTGVPVDLKYIETKTHMACFRETNYLILDVMPLEPLKAPEAPRRAPR
jgi:hypothetical protein